jgi:hypothetical protein
MTFQYFHLRRKKTLDTLTRWIVKPDTYAIHWSNNGTIAKSVPQGDDDLLKMQERQLFSRLAIEAAFPTGLPGT